MKVYGRHKPHLQANNLYVCENVDNHEPGTLVYRVHCQNWSNCHPQNDKTINNVLFSLTGYNDLPMITLPGVYSTRVGGRGLGSTSNLFPLLFLTRPEYDFLLYLNPSPITLTLVYYAILKPPNGIPWLMAVDEATREWLLHSILDT